MLERLFSNKKNEDKVNADLIKRLNGRHVRCVTKRNSVKNNEEIIGREGYINLNNGDLIICCDNKILFRCSTDKLKAGELLSLEGVTLKSDDWDYTIIAYYKYYR